LGEVGDPLPGYWQGKAADGQQQTSVNLISEIHEAARQCRELADGLDELANEIEGYNDSIHELWIAVASIAAVSIVGAFFTFGASAAAGAATTAGLVTRAGLLLRALQATLMATRPLMFAGRASNFVGLGARWANVVRGISFTPRLVPAGERLARLGAFYKDTGIVFVAGLPFTYINKALSNGKPWELKGWQAASDPANYRVEDLTASLWGAAIFGGVGGKFLPFPGPLPKYAPGSGALGRLGYTGRLWSGGFPAGFGRGLLVMAPLNSPSVAS
jgi:hypothetical protein